MQLCELRLPDSDAETFGWTGVPTLGQKHSEITEPLPGSGSQVSIADAACETFLHELKNDRGEVLNGAVAGNR